MSGEQRRRVVENHLVIWVDATIDKSKESWQKKIAKVQGIINDVNTFTQPNESIEFLNSITLEKVFLITSGSLGKHLVPEIHEMTQLHSIYIFCRNKQFHKTWARNWPKVKGVHKSMKSICKLLRMTVKQCDQNNTTISIIGVNEEVSSENFNQLDLVFMYTQILNEIILDTEHDQKAIKELVKFCEEKYLGNTEELQLIDEFQRTYHPTSTIWWYTRQCFIYKMLNRALRTLDGDVIIRMGFFLCNLHRQIEILHKRQSSQYLRKIFLVYRGQGLLIADYEKLTRNKGGLISFNNLLSTSENRDVSFNFAKNALTTTDMVGILFQITIDSTISSIPFASIQEVSYFKNENEILFPIHTVFRIDDIREIDDRSPLYEVDLQLTSDDNQQLRQLTEHIRKEVTGSTGWHRIGKLLLRLGRFDKAEELYTTLLEQTSDERERSNIYHHLGCLKNDQGQYQRAISFYKASLEIHPKAFSEDNLSLASTYNSIGNVYTNIGNYSKALEFYDEAHKILEKALPPNHSSLATSYNNIGQVYQNMGNYSKALQFYDKAVQIKEKTLPSTHPDLATSYNNIGQVYKTIDDYSKTLEFYEKARKILEKALPPNRPDLAMSYNNIGGVYYSMGNYSKAVEFYDKALHIRETDLPPNHPGLAMSYNNIGVAYYSMGDYWKALTFFGKVHEIFEKALPRNHPDLATSYNNIGLVYDNMGDYSIALEFYKKAQQIEEKALSLTHPDVAITNLNFAACYERMGNYAAALKAVQNAFQIQRQAFQEGNPDYAFTYNRLGRVYRGMKDYSKALEYFERALALRQQTLPETHPNRAITYADIGDIHRLMGNYEMALSFQRKALNIQENVQCSPLDRATTYMNLGETYREMKDYSTALTYFQKALQIYEHKLPKNHPDLALIYHSLAKLYLATQQNSMAIKNVQQAIEISEEKLSSNHPNLLDYKNTFEKIRGKL